MRLSKFLSTAALITGLGLTAPAFAQQATYDDTAIDAFVTAALAANVLEQRYTAQLAEATTDAEREALIATANEEIIETIDATPGVDFAAYVEISEAAQADPELHARIMTAAQELQTN